MQLQSQCFFCGSDNGNELITGLNLMLLLQWHLSATCPMACLLRANAAEMHSLWSCPGCTVGAPATPSPVVIYMLHSKHAVLLGKHKQ